MPKKNEKPISDELLVSNGVWDLEPTLPLSERQVALMTIFSVGQLKERRRMRPPQPPFPMKPDDTIKRGAAVWYPLGEVLAYKKAQLARPLPPIARPSPTTIHTFATFLRLGRLSDSWVFAHTTEGQPIDFFASLRLGKLIDPRGECGWLTLDEYLAEMTEWTARQRSQAQTRGLAELPAGRDAGADAFPACPRCGRPKRPSHRCSI